MWYAYGIVVMFLLKLLCIAIAVRRGDMVEVPSLFWTITDSLLWPITLVVVSWRSFSSLLKRI